MPDCNGALSQLHSVCGMQADCSSWWETNRTWNQASPPPLSCWPMQLCSGLKQPELPWPTLQATGKKGELSPRLGDIEVSPQFKQKHKTGVNMNAKFRGCPGECHAPIPTVTAARCSLPRLLVLQKSSCSSWCSHWQGPKLCGASPVICRQSTKPFVLSHTLRAYLDAPNKYNTVPA